ncbi:hypothetical protein ACFX2G_014401 [Malus domestica]
MELGHLIRRWKVLVGGAQQRRVVARGCRGEVLAISILPVEVEAVDVYCGRDLLVKVHYFQIWFNLVAKPHEGEEWQLLLP